MRRQQKHKTEGNGLEGNTSVLSISNHRDDEHVTSLTGLAMIQQYCQTKRDTEPSTQVKKVHKSKS